MKCGKIREEILSAVLPHKAHTFSSVFHQAFFGHCIKICPIDIESSGGRFFKTADHVKQCGFTASALTDNGYKFASFNLKFKSLKSKYFHFIGLVNLNEAVTDKYIVILLIYYLGTFDCFHIFIYNFCFTVLRAHILILRLPFRIQHHRIP